MHKVNILPSLSLARFFLTQQLIYKSKIEKYNVSLDIFLSDTSIVRNFNLLGLEKKAFQLHKDTHTLSGSDSGIYFAQNQITFEDQGLIIEVKNYLH